MSQAEAEFWSFVARERAALEQARAEEVPTLLEWLEREIVEAREVASYLRAKGERGEEYWTGWADSLETLLKKIQRGEVRV